MDDFHIDINIHYALEHYSKFFSQCATGMAISTTQKRECTLIGLSNEFPAINRRVREVTFTDRNYRNAEQVWMENERADMNEIVLSELITEVRIGILKFVYRRLVLL